MSTWLVVAIVVAVVAVVVKRLIGEPVNVRDLFAPPVVLLAIGVVGLVKAEHVTGVDIAWIVAGSAVGLGMGALRGATPKLFTKDGVLWHRYTGWTFGVWVLSVAVNGGLDLVATANGLHHDVKPVQLAIGVSLLGEAVVIGLRSMRAGVPFAPDRPSLVDRLIKR
ncbi:DUF1453 family protein [Actinocrispum wychmicini]|uniref:Uncharacterized protein DUF1453 n=1 Tax=Actinocrispum wychmicini TaxID=1213861 RepID=A0A4R2IMS2_9PSEU|nr:DUF1453 family protein [Actinocrispum wychmicini]TCO45289.1 uncharacterized protein DUF1453 [Actinocrispum wychmicini]